MEVFVMLALAIGGVIGIAGLITHHPQRGEQNPQPENTGLAPPEADPLAEITRLQSMLSAAERAAALLEAELTRRRSEVRSLQELQVGSSARINALEGEIAVLRAKTSPKTTPRPGGAGALAALNTAPPRLEIERLRASNARLLERVERLESENTRLHLKARDKALAERAPTPSTASVAGPDPRFLNGHNLENWD